MNDLYLIDSKVKHFGKRTISQEEYDQLKRQTKVFPYVIGKKWIAQLSKLDETCSLMTFSTGVEVVARLVDTDTGVVRLRLKYHDGIAIVEKDFDCNILTKLGVKELYNYGIRFSEDDSNMVVKYLVKSESVAPIIRTYSKLGWRQEGDVRLLRGHSALSAEGVYKALTYNGKLDLKPTGSLDKWLEMVKKEVLKSIAMTVVMLLGFAGALVALLNEKKDIGSLMFNLSNKSSKGKTTSAMLAASVFSCPTLNRGCAISYNATENALIQFISCCGAHTVIVDEAAMNGNNNIQKLLYNVCNGRSKMRLNGDATQKEVTEFNSIVISTAEFNLLNEDMPNGIKTRVFEINDSLTDSAENSDNIKACIFENYAVAGEVFIKYLLRKGNRVFDDYEKNEKFLWDKCKEKKELSERILSKLATVLTTAQYVNEIFKMGINEDEISDYLLNLERKISMEVKPEERLLEIVRQEVSKNSSKYMINTSVVPSCCHGAIKTKGKISEIQISETVFEDMMESYSVADWHTVLKKLKEHGILQTESDRLYKRVTLLSEVGRQKCFCFKVDNCIQPKPAEAPRRILEDEIGETDIFDGLSDDIFQ